MSSAQYAKYSGLVSSGDVVTSVDGISGAITLVAGSNITITPAGQNITIAASGGGGSGVNTIGTIDSLPPSSDGAAITGTSLVLQSASDTEPGLVNTTTQTLAGNKTIDGTIAATNLSGTNTGNVTIAAFGSTPNANGLSLSGQALNLQPADATHSGGLSTTDWNTFNGKQAAGSYITALTGDGTASGPGSAALTLATVNSNVGSFGTASSVGGFTVNGKGLVTAAASTPIQIAESQVTNLVSDLAGKQATGSYITALTGDVAASGPGSAAATIQPAAVSLAKMANLAANSIIGNNTGSGATPIALTVSQVNTLLGSFVNPMTTGGDVIYGGASGVATRLANGSSGQVLTSAGTTLAPTWSTPTSNGANVVSKVANYSAVANDYVLCSGAAFTVTLPTAVGISGQTIVVKKTDSSLTNVITIATTSAQNIDGSAPVQTLNTLNEVYVFQSDNVGWQITEHKTATSWATITTIPITSTAAHVFTIASSSVTAGAVYSNNGINFTVSLTIASGTTLTCAGFGNPLAATSTLTKVSGVGPSTLSYTAVTNAQPVKGTSSIDQYQWRRIGDSVEVWYQLTLTGVGTAGGGDYLLDLSSIGSFASSILIAIPTVTATGAQAELVTYMPYRIPAYGLSAVSGSSFTWVSDIVPYSSTLYKINASGNASNGFIGSTLQAFNVVVGYTVKFTVPILGWQP